MSLSRKVSLWRLRYCARNSSFILAMSTPVGHSRRQPLHETQSDMVSAIASEVSAPGPSWPESARRSVLARPRVRCCSSPVARYDGHITPGSDLRQAPLLLHISAALAKPPHSDQSSAVSIGICR